MTALRNSRHSREGGNPQGMEGGAAVSFAKRKGDTSERSEIAGHAGAAAANQSNFLLAACVNEGRIFLAALGMTDGTDLPRRTNCTSPMIINRAFSHKHRYKHKEL